MKFFGGIITMLSIVGILLMIGFGIYTSYEYKKKISSYWELADKASTIEQKSERIDVFVANLEAAGLQGRYNAIILKTPDDSFDANFYALKSFQSRLQEIQSLDPESFQYNTAIAQITEQEQGQAHEMLDVFCGTWFLVHYPFLWNWLAICSLVSLIILGLIGSIMSADKYY
jgi:hypothetical protein